MISGHILEVELTGQVDAAEKAGVRNQCDSLASVPVWLVIPFQVWRQWRDLEFLRALAISFLPANKKHFFVCLFGSFCFHLSQNADLGIVMILLPGASCLHMGVICTS